MARQRTITPAPWPSLVLDSGGLGKLAQGDGWAKAALDSTMSVALVPSMVLAEALQGGPEDANINRVLKGLEIVSITAELARGAASLKRQAGLSGVQITIDAVVVAVSVSVGGGAIMTTDPKDIRRLAASRPELGIRPIPVEL